MGLRLNVMASGFRVLGQLQRTISQVSGGKIVLGAVLLRVSGGVCGDVIEAISLSPESSRVLWLVSVLPGTMSS